MTVLAIHRRLHRCGKAGLAGYALSAGGSSNPIRVCPPMSGVLNLCALARSEPWGEEACRLLKGDPESPSLSRRLDTRDEWDPVKVRDGVGLTERSLSLPLRLRRRNSLANGLLKVLPSLSSMKMSPLTGLGTSRAGPLLRRESKDLPAPIPSRYEEYRNL